MSFADMQERARHKAELRKALGSLAEDVDDAQATRLLRTTGWDADFAAIAVKMHPRPDWVEEILGPLTTPSGLRSALNDSP